MEVRRMLSAIMLASACATPALAAPGAPGLPAVETEITTELNADGDHPSASAWLKAQCAGTGGSVIVVNGATVPAPHAPATVIGATRSAAAPDVVNGAAVPAFARLPGDPTWCAGAYREDLGTNFGE